jgi:hypothetical protein
MKNIVYGIPMIRYLFLLILLITFAISCSVEKSEARIALESYLTDLQKEDFNLAYEHLSPELKNECSLNDFKYRAKKNFEAINHSRLVYKSESKLNDKNIIKVEFMIKVDDREVDLFDMEIMDTYLDQETASLILINEKFKLNNLIWPVDWCEKPDG